PLIVVMHCWTVHLVTAVVLTTSATPLTYFLFLRIRRRPTSTLFPYTTLFRSAYSIVIGSKHITLNATGGGFLTASKQFRHGATSKSRSNTASNSTKHKSPHLSGWRQIISLIT